MRGGLKSDPTATYKDYDLILSIANNKTIFGLPNEFVSNMPVTSTSNVNNTEFLSEEDVVFIDEAHENENVDESVVQPLNWGKYKPALLQTPLHPVLNNVRSGTEKTPNHSRRQAATIVKSLTTSEISQKYDELLEGLAFRKC
ncbi:hypothetical protein FQA39_LY16184 [Lamprigera yunnana]|nr:hypothetical protein FQA39_LY16184 [Lamprigera yunnana]